jgi:two-component system LytT family response regulator
MKTRNKIIEPDTALLSSAFTQVHVGSRTYIKPAEIVMISADISYSYIHLSNGKKIFVSTNIQKLQERLLGVRNMVRVHRSYIINTKYLKYIDGAIAFLVNDNQCIISRRKKNNLFNLIQLNN